MSRKILMLTLCITLVSAFMLYGEADTHNATPQTDHAFRVANPGSHQPEGSRSTPILIDQISLSTINGTGYCWGLAYDWERDALWVSQWNSAYMWVYAIQKTSPCTKVDSFLASGPSYQLGMGYGGSDVMYIAGYDANIYEIDMTTGAVSVFRSLPWGSAEGLGFNVVDDAVYPGDWVANQCAWAQPAQSGSWNTWSLTSPSGMSGAYSASMSPNVFFTVDENASQAHFYQHSMSGGVPNTTPDSIWDCAPGQTQASTADMACDGQYVYILDQSGPDMIWVYDVGLPPPSDTARWDFETGHQGWTHTNGLPFPGGWDVMPSGYKPTYTPPNADDSTYWIDSDDYGSATSDTALSPIVVPNAVTTNWLWWGIGYNYLSGDFVEVGIKYHDGSSWTIVPLATYTADVSPKDDSADVSAYNTYPLVQVYVYYEAPGWDWYAAFDNVTINGTFPTLHDVGTKSIDAPGVQIMPNTVLDPTATFKNYGAFDETFDVYFEIDTNGAPFYTNTRNITVVSDAESTVAFDQCTFGGITGFTYDITVYTILTDDSDPANDTLTQQTIINPTFWEILDPPQMPNGSSGHSMASGHDGFIYVSGVNTGVMTTDLYIYDIAGNTWATGTPAPTASAYGTAAYCNGNFYKIGGTTTWPTPLTAVDIYDITAGTWSSGATSPTGLLDEASGVFNDSLIFTFGNGNWGVTPTNAVYMYDAYLDSWTTATSFPGTARGCAAGGIIDTFAIIACGYLSTGAYGNDYIVGIIDPADPANISWGSFATIPVMGAGRYRVPGACDDISNTVEFNREFYIVGGQNGPFADTYSYDPLTDTWTDWAAPKPTPVGNVSPVAVAVTTMGDVGVFCAGGYTGSYVANNEVFHTGKDTIPPGIGEEPGQKTTPVFGFAPETPTLVNNYTAIKYSTSQSGKVSLKVYDATGRMVRTLVNRPRERAGTKTVYWNSKDNSGRTVSAGVYFFRLTVENKTATLKTIVVR